MTGNLLDKNEFWKMTAVNTHCHHLREPFFKEISLHKLLQMTYVSWIIRDPGDTDEGHQVYFSKMKANSYFYWWRRAVEDIYGDGRELTPETWGWFDEKVRQAYTERQDQDIKLLKQRCKYSAVLLDDYEDPGSDHGLPALMRPVFRCDMFLCGYSYGKTDENHNHAFDYFPARPDSIETYVAYTKSAITEAVQKGAVGLKIAIAYERSLEFVPGTYEKAKEAFGNESATDDQKKAFADYIMFKIAETAGQMGIPVQIHTGLGALSGSRAIGLRDLIALNPDTKFDLFHASYPWCDDVLGLAHNYPNVYVDLCWLPLISTSRSVHFLKEALELIESDRIIWGCDTWTGEESFGARMAVHQCMKEVFNSFIRDGVLSREDALSEGRQILSDNAAKLYRLF